MKLNKILSLAGLAAGALFAANVASGQLVITGVADTDLSGAPRFVELYATQNINSGDLLGWSLRRSSDGSSWSSAAADPFDTLSATAGSFLYFIGNQTEFDLVAGASNGLTTILSTSIDGVTGANQWALVSSGTDLTNAIDRAPTPGLDSAAYRTVNGSGPDGSTLVSDNWTITDLDGQNQTQHQTYFSNTFGSYSPVPEPSTYAAILGLLVLGFVAYRRRNLK